LIPGEVLVWLEAEGFGSPGHTQGVSGGCINNGVRLKTTTGASFFLKTNPHCPPDMFAQEVAGLHALSVPGGPRVPKPYLHGADFLLMEDLSPAPRKADYWETFGEQMAALHLHTHPRFGFEADNYIGSTPQPNPWTEDGFDFYARHRFGFQADLAARNGLLTSQEAAEVHRMAERLRELVPGQSASILHGDLWSGNATTDETGQPAIIDPAAYYGWAEADLAMMVLFGSPPSRFFDAYQAVRPLANGWQERFTLYNSYHLLNHLNLFGRSYHAQTMSAVRRFSGT